MDKPITLHEMENRFDGEWVLVVDPTTDELQRVLSGVVAFHSADVDSVYRKLFEIQPKSSAVFYVGSMPEGAAVAL